MKLSAATFATILALVAALASPAQAERPKDKTPNDLACFGIWEMCSGLCQAQHGADDEAWADCIKSCGDDVRICRARDNMVLSTGSLSSSNSSVFDPGSPSTTGGNGGGSGGGNGGGGAPGTFGGDGTASLNNAGMDAGGGAATIY